MLYEVVLKKQLSAIIISSVFLFYERSFQTGGDHPLSWESNKVSLAKVETKFYLFILKNLLSILRRSFSVYENYDIYENDFTEFEKRPLQKPIEHCGDFPETDGTWICSDTVCQLDCNENVREDFILICKKTGWRLKG